MTMLRPDEVAVHLAVAILPFALLIAMLVTTR